MLATSSALVDGYFWEKLTFFVIEKRYEAANALLASSMREKLLKTFQKNSKKFQIEQGGRKLLQILLRLKLRNSYQS